MKKRNINDIKKIAIDEVAELIKKGYAKSKAIKEVADKYNIWHTSLKYAYEHDYVKFYKR